MIKPPTRVSCFGVLVVAGVVLTGCSGGPSDTEFVEACLQEGKSAASQMLHKELGVTREAFCKCGEPVARASLSTDGYRAMVLDMQGKGEEARAITSKMNESEQMAAIGVLAKMMEKCVADR